MRKKQYEKPGSYAVLLTGGTLALPQSEGIISDNPATEPACTKESNGLGDGGWKGSKDLWSNEW